MALSISEACIACNACKLVCPSNAILTKSPHFQIAAHRCDECQSTAAVAQCASICPVENAILDANGIALNPTGSLAPISFNFNQPQFL
ncbi:4Fe-4S binding protein [Reinekea thalattae]|uniref:Ferredoxin n=1 Tax=Reinekea thalattae TaxID=2593301 RepID=A0A5C8Z709_9GAMM|nr:4Fe-4S binding protein [Reinekea thalattae]TXR53018.1 ferredoxin [Reinekea thalattae]